MCVCVVGMPLGKSWSVGKQQPEGRIIADAGSLENNCVAYTNILLLLNFNDGEQCLQ